MSRDLHLDLDPRFGVRGSLERALRAAVRGGRLVPGTRLPSSRVLAVDLGVARNTVAEVYTQLVAEGYLMSRRSAGTFVAPRHEASRDPMLRGAAGHRLPVPVRYDLRPGRPNLDLFPQADWFAALRRVLAGDYASALGYTDSQGAPRARAVLAEYLARVRGVEADPDCVVLCSGYRQGVALVASALSRRGVTSVAVEAPGLPEVAEAFGHHGVQPVPLGVDRHGARIEELDLLGVGGVVLTPAHQFPMGVALSPARRGALVDWARRRSAVIVEDDYDAEFRYDRQPIGAIQGLAPERVVYAGSVSKTLAPGIRLGWLVVPRYLLAAVVEEKRLADRHSSALDQLALAELIASGDYDRHIRRARAQYRRRRDELNAGMSVLRLVPSPADVMQAGLHTLVPLSSPTRERRLVARLAAAGVAVNGLARYGPPDRSAGLVVGYAAPSQHAWRPTVEALLAHLV